MASERTITTGRRKPETVEPRPRRKVAGILRQSVPTLPPLADLPLLRSRHTPASVAPELDLGDGRRLVLDAPDPFPAEELAVSGVN